MTRQTDKYQYAQVDTYKESLELKHLKRKTFIVNTIIFLCAMAVLYFLLLINSDVNTILTIMVLFGSLLMMNFAFYAYDDDHYNSLKIAMYVNTIGVYAIAIALIFKFQTPSVFTSLFLAYAISSIYQDYKAMLLSNLALFVSGTSMIFSYEEVFEIAGNQNPQRLSVFIFLTVFVSLLTLSSYILIKRKNFFYNQLAQIKESELRNINLFYEVDKIKREGSLNSETYYDSLEKFSKELSRKIGIENVFKRKIELLRDLKTLTSNDVLKKYTEYTIEEIEEISNMELELHTKMKEIGLKSSQSFGVEVTRKEMFSETQFKSFKHFGDHHYVKVISFVVFYCLLKVNKPYLNALEEEKIKDILFNSEYFHRVDRDIIKVYLENNEVFDAIVKDHMEGSW